MNDAEKENDMLKSIVMVGGLFLGLAGAAHAEEKNFNLLEVCKKDCPTAKSDEDAHRCAEKMGRLNKSFKKSKCWEVNEQYEAATKGKKTKE